MGDSPRTYFFAASAASLAVSLLVLRARTRPIRSRDRAVVTLLVLTALGCFAAAVITAAGA